MASPSSAALRDIFTTEQENGEARVDTRPRVACAVLRAFLSFHRSSEAITDRMGCATRAAGNAGARHLSKWGRLDSRVGVQCQSRGY